MLPWESVLDLDNHSEPELDIRFQDDKATIPRNPLPSPDTSDSENAPLLSPRRVPGRYKPSKLKKIFDDKTFTVIYNKKNLPRKTIARKTNSATRGSLKPKWNIIPDGTVTNYLPHTITLDTNSRKNTFIRQNDLPIVTQTIPKQTETSTKAKPRLIHMVACKEFNEYHSNQRKQKLFYLEEQAARTVLAEPASGVTQNPVN